MLGGLNAFYLLEDEPTVYGLPVAPKLPTRNLAPSSVVGVGAAVLAGLAGMIAFRKRRMDAGAPNPANSGGAA